MSGALDQFVLTLTGRPVDVATGPVPGRVIDGEAFFQADTDRGLGPAIRWAWSAIGPRLDRLHVLAAPSSAPILARRAALLDVPIDVWTGQPQNESDVVGSDISPDDQSAFVRATPTDYQHPPVLPESHWALASVLAEAGARPVDDHGVLVGEVAGLEVARVVEAETSDASAAAPDGPRLDVGVGLADRELQQFVNGHRDGTDNLRNAITAVARHRRPGAAVHPLSRVARQRWLRSIILDDPSIVGLDRLEPVVPLRPKRSVLATEPAVAAGDGVVVVCSVGVDLDLAPEAADYRARFDAEADLVIVVPERDQVLADGGTTGLVPRCEVRSIDLPWNDAEQVLA